MCGCSSLEPLAYFEKGSYDGNKGYYFITVDATNSKDIRLIDCEYTIFENDKKHQRHRGIFFTVPEGKKERLKIPLNSSFSSLNLQISGKLFFYPTSPFKKTLFDNGLYKPSLKFNGFVNQEDGSQ